MKTKILGLLVVFSMFFMAMPAKASTLDDLIAQVKSLQSEVATLQSSLSALALNAVGAGTTATTTTSAPATVTPVLTTTINAGTTSSDVVKLQNFLIAQGLLAPGNATGFYGKLTTQAVQAYQTKNSLPVTGNVDLATLTAINTNTIRYYDSTLGKNIKVSQAVILGGGISNMSNQGTVTCSGSCTGNSCLVEGCDPNFGTDCTSCSCIPETGCSACTCTKTKTGIVTGFN